MTQKSLIAWLTGGILLFSAIAGTTAEARETKQTKHKLLGIASYYASRFHGRPTASGERYNRHELTAAHRFFPFGTLVRVLNLKNGRSIVVRINDRGPFHGGRIIDLSSAAARALGFIKAGMAKVKLEVIHFPGKGDPPPLPAPSPDSDPAPDEETSVSSLSGDAPEAASSLTPQPN